MVRLFGASVLLVLATPAFAQEQEVEDWSGPYISVSAAGDSQQVTTSSTDSVNQVTNLIVPGRGLVVVPGTSVATSGSDTETGFSGGAAFGWLGQSGGFVYGVELGGNFGQSSSGTSSTASLPVTVLTPVSTVVATRTVKKDYDWSARLRLGFATGKALLYASGGVAGTRAQLTAIDTYTDPGGPAAPCTAPCTVANFGPYGPAVATSTARNSFIGWTAGAGIDYRLAGSFSIGIDYRHSNFGAKTLALGAATPVNSGATITDGSGNHPPANTGAVPGSTRVDLRDERLAFTLSFHF
ncbi:outer membrane beta-barrel protein [Sphingomonas sp. LB-2]|uniref:outer membrane protein n=1 Tax=Sphingomonas caeni TaxID=2984949 RepID=UPI002232244E|nr:outer membrane beta-barrel protein [Sphingomonas caeni]MCW3848727.1 outer membrane beta-barrel protein [Sphingomonas caeni]